MSKCKHKWSKPTIDTEVISGKESGIVPYEDVYKRSYVSCEKCGAVKEKFLGRNRIVCWVIPSRSSLKVGICLSILSNP